MRRYAQSRRTGYANLAKSKTKTENILLPEYCYCKTTYVHTMFLFICLMRNTLGHAASNTTENFAHCTPQNIAPPTSLYFNFP